MKKILGIVIGAGWPGLSAMAHPGHDNLHGVVGLDHPVALLAFVVFSGLVLLAASWHSKRTTRKP